MSQLEEQGLLGVPHGEGYWNLRGLLALADETDRREGQLAYARYGLVLRSISERFGTPYEPTVAAFVALSPNSDYIGNLRSLVSLLKGFKSGLDIEQITISTYRHCGRRALSYLRGEALFLEQAKGPKIRAFYQNIIDPLDPHPVTIDGHMSAAWQGKRLTMKEAIIKPRQYEEIAQGFRCLAAEIGWVPNQLQACLWFTRKRVFRIKYAAQLSLFHGPGDAWQTIQALEDLPPYGS